MDDDGSKSAGEELAPEVRAFLDAASDAIFLLDGPTFVDCNAETLRMFRCERAQIVGQPPYRFSPPLQADGRDSESAARDRIAAVLAGRPQFFEWRHRRYDGAPFDAEVSLSRVDLRGGTRVLAIVRDITGRKGSEAALRASEDLLRRIFEHAPMAMAIVGMDGTIERINEKAIEVFGYLPADIPTMDRWWMLAYPDSDYRAEVTAIWMGLVGASLETGGEIEGREYHVTCKDGTVKTMQILGVPVADKVFVMFGDVTERVREAERLQSQNAELERRVRERTAELERTNEELASFAYSISHELRAPIARLSGFARELTEGVETADAAELAFFAERIQASSRHLRQVIDSLLLLTRLSRADLAKEAIDLSQMAAGLVARLLEGRGPGEVLVTIAPGLVLHGDRSMWEVCLQNLLDNAVKYSSKSPAPAVELGAVDEPDGPVFFVRDNGAGFDMAHAGKLFQPFCRLHTASEFPGTGVGLATAQRIVERHGGRLWAESAPGCGATFYFTVGT
jgi:hypothetical protein